MALDFGMIFSGLFPDSAEAGVGLGGEGVTQDPANLFQTQVFTGIFWADPDQYIVYDDFETGAVIDASKWTIVTENQSISATTYAAGPTPGNTKEAFLWSTNYSNRLVSKILPQGKKGYHMKFYVNRDAGTESEGTCTISMDNINWYKVGGDTRTSGHYQGDILIIKDMVTNSYSLFGSGKLMQTGYTGTIYLAVDGGGGGTVVSRIYIDEAVYSRT